MRAWYKKNMAFGAMAPIAFGLAAFGLAGCGGGEDDDTTADGSTPVAYVKRDIDPNDRQVAGNPTDSITTTRGGDLYVLPRSSTAATDCNITGSYTQGRGDVSDPEVSPDGKHILFSMKRSTDDTWDIWEADVSGIVNTGKCQPATLRRLIDDNGKSSDPNATWGDDVDPAYLCDGRIVFSSNRQEQTFRTLGHKYIDEYEREPTIVLHTMSINGSIADNRNTIRQISFNMSHDRNPTVLDSCEIMFSRWDHVGTRNQFTVFKINTDGTGLFVLFGSHSGVNSYLHPRQMMDGRIMSDAMPLSGTNEGGALMIIDVKNYAEANQPAPMIGSGTVAQYQPSVQQIDVGMRASNNGRFTTPYPLWDGTNRALVSFTPGQRVDTVTEPDPINGGTRDVQRERTPAYGVYMMDLGTGTLRDVKLPRVNNGSPDQMITDPIPLMARTNRGGGLSGIIPIDTSSDSVMATRKVGRLTVKSIYDTDAENRMSNSVLTAWERDTSNPYSIAIVDKVNDASCGATDNRDRYPFCDTRRRVPDLMWLKDPLRTPADNRAGRFVRISRAVPTVSGLSRRAIGETEFEMQQLLGYVPVEPDGSFSVEVPADTPIALAVTDAYGRAFQTHTSWLNVRPGETVTCKGCHSPRRSSPNSLNQASLRGSVAGTNPHSVLQDTSGNPVAGGTPITGETMVETRLRVDRASLARLFDLEYRDVWTDRDDANNPLPKAGPISIRYDGSTFRGTTSAGITNSAQRPYSVNVDGFAVTDQAALVINYEDHIQPIWDRACVSCHTGTAQYPDLSGGGASGSGRYASYDALLIGLPELVNGLPRLRERDGEIEVVRLEAPVTPGLARGTTLIDKIFPQGMKNPAEYASGSAASHANYLNLSEKRLVTEWIDLGAQYFNDPCTARDNSGNCTGYRAVVGLSESVFTSTIQPLLLQQCAGCHVAVGRSPNDPPFQAKRLVLTGSDGDFSVTASMVTNVCDSGSSYLLTYPTSSMTATPPSPLHPTVFSNTSDSYNTIQGWIDAARTANGC